MRAFDGHPYPVADLRLAQDDGLVHDCARLDLQDDPGLAEVRLYQRNAGGGAARQDDIAYFDYCTGEGVRPQEGSRQEHISHGDTLSARPTWGWPGGKMSSLICPGKPGQSRF